MTGFWVLDCLCLAVVLVCAVLVAKLRNLNGAVMSLSALGTILALLFVVLEAPDVAQSEIVVGAIALPALFAAMVFMSASFSLRLSRYGGIPRIILYSALAGFGVYFFSDLTQALGQSGVLPLPLAATVPAAAAILVGMTLVFHQEDG